MPATLAPSIVAIPEILAERIAPDGGATLDYETGDTPTSGFAVSVAGAEDRVTGTPDPDRISRWLQDTAAAGIFEVVQMAGYRPYVGAWVDQGLTYLDVSVVVPTREEAETLGRQWGQVAIFDLASRETIRL